MHPFPPSSLLSSSSSVLFLVTLKELVLADAEASSTPPRDLSVPSLPLPPIMAATPWSQSEGEASRSQDEEEPSTWRDQEGAKSVHPDPLHLLVVELVGFLFHKYCTKDPTTKDEILNMVLREDGHHFPEAVHQASECLQLVFSMDVREVDHPKHTYVLVPTLGLTCNGMVSGGHSMPKASNLVVVLGMILLEGNCAHEEEIWETLNDMGIYVKREHYICGEPRKC